MRAMAQNVDWKNLGFKYMQTDSFVRADYSNGNWGDLKTYKDPVMPFHIAATAFHYGQAAFEGLKAFSRKDGTIGIFRPLDNARRMINTAQRLVMQAPNEELFLEAVKTVVSNNREWVPPYGTGASLYIRPFLIGTSPHVGISPSEEYAFIVLCMPVGPYYKNGFYPVKAMVQEKYDRAAPHGVGNVKAAGNYAAGMLGDIEGKNEGYPICLYLDSAEHHYIDEFGTSNFFAITKDNVYVTPQSSSILPSITNRSIQDMAQDFGLKVENRLISVDELESFVEVGACGTAAVITPVYSIKYRDRTFTFGNEHEAGATVKRFFKEIQSIQYGETDDRHGWIVTV
jgi:branched-chain amino acid aminotransferase